MHIIDVIDALLNLVFWWGERPASKNSGETVEQTDKPGADPDRPGRD